MNKLLLIDGHSIMNRAFYGVPDFTNSEGIHTNAIYGFLNILFKLFDIEKPDMIAVAFDVHAKTFRHEKYSEYKGTRKPMKEELRQQIPLIKDVLRSMNISVFEMAGYEADDILGTLSLKGENEGIDVTIVSGDRDLLQLSSKKVKISMPKTSKGVTTVEDYYEGDVLEKYKVTPKQFIDVKALMGDSSDNIKGVAGIGEKTATNLISTYGSIDGLYEHIDELKNGKAKTNLIEGREDAIFSRFLVTIKRDVPIDVDLNDLYIENMFTKECLDYMKKFEFKSFISRFEFDNTDNDTEEIEKNFDICDDFSMVTSKLDDVLKSANNSNKLAISIVKDGSYVLTVAITGDGKDIKIIPVEFFITDDLIFDKIKEFDFKNIKLCMFDAKDIIKTIGLDAVIYKDIEDDYKNFDIYSESIEDNKVMAYLLDPLKSDYSYDQIAMSYMSLNLPSKEELLGKDKIKDVFDSKRENIYKLAGFECYVNYNCVDSLKHNLSEKGMESLYNDIEKPLVLVLCDMENEGILVRKEELVDYSNRLDKSIKEIENNIYEMAGHEFNINSPKQLGVVLFEELELPGGKKTKTGYSTNAAVLEKLQDDYDIVKEILLYRSLTKLKSTYADGLVTFIDDDGRIRGKFNQTVTATGRISSTDPNLQNIPVRMEMGKAIRKVFVAKDGCTFVDADYSQIELRVLAHMSEDEVLIESYLEDYDIHKITASKVFKVPLDEVTSDLRRRAKAVNFGIVYGISSFGLGEDLKISRKEADGYIKEYFKTYPKLYEFLEGLKENAKKEGYVKTIYGRIRPVPEITSGQFMQVKFGERIAMNSPIQGSAADIMKIAMINVYRELKKAGLKSKILVQVHDEILVETPKDEEEKVKELVKSVMENAAKLKVPLEVEVNSGDNWLVVH